MVSSVFISL
jgi:hypothetical protein